MRAARLTAIQHLSVTEVPTPRPGPGEALVRLHAAALNHRDLWIKLGQYAGLKFPCTPGSDGCGAVEALGDGADPAWLGVEVIINPAFAWGDDPDAQGPDFHILGLPRDGTLAQYVSVPAAQLARKPAHLSPVEAAALPLAGLTAYRAVYSRARVQPGERVLVTGIGGGVALFAMQFALALGAAVWVTSSSEEKIARAVALGAQGGYRYTDPSWIASAKSVGGFHAIVDSAGGEGFESLVDLAAPGGRVVFFGATRGNPPVLPMRKVFWRQLSLLGTTMGSPADWAAMVALVETSAIKPVVSDVFALERAPEAFDLMERGGQFGKIVVTM